MTQIPDENYVSAAPAMSDQATPAAGAGTVSRNIPMTSIQTALAAATVQDA